MRRHPMQFYINELFVNVKFVIPHLVINLFVEHIEHLHIAQWVWKHDYLYTDNCVDAKFYYLRYFFYVCINIILLENSFFFLDEQHELIIMFVYMICFVVCFLIWFIYTL